MTIRRVQLMLVLSLFAVACRPARAESTADRFLFPKDGGIYVGVDYYPEHWPEERWETDLRLMHEAGFNVVRLAEFSWVLFEPQEGKYDFGWLDRFLALAQKYGVHAIIGTPTAIPPAWMARRYPEIMAMKADGTRIEWGGRRNNCFTDADFQRVSKAFVEVEAKHYANHPNVIGWQIDNELGGTDCRCDKCRAGFQKWLKEKYGTLDELNRAWGTHFWSQKLQTWDEIPLPVDREGDWAISNPSMSLDWKRFTSNLEVDFLDTQVKILRATCSPSQFITHNCMGLYNGINYYDLAKPLDFVSWDNYPKLAPAISYESSLAADVMRGLKKQNFLIMEQTAGPLGWSIFSRNPQPGELREICYQQLAHGADGQIWFRWRSCTVGREQYWHGLLGHDGKPGRRYDEAAKVAKEYQQLAPQLVGTTPRPPVAIVYDYDSAWALQIQKGYPEASHQKAIQRYYNALFRAGINVDIVRPGDSLDGYKLVFAPHLHVLPDAVAKQLESFVRDGGVLLADCRTGVKDMTNLAYDRTLPGLLSSALGIEIPEYESLRLGITDNEETTYTVQSEEEGLAGTYVAIHYADWIKPTAAKPIARYAQPHLKDYAAVTRNEFGKGIGWYVGTIAKEDAFYDKLVARLLLDAKVKPLVQPPAGVEVAIRSGDKHGLLILLNHSEQEKSVPVPPGKKELLTGKQTEKALTLDAFGVAVVELTADDLKSVQRSTAP